ncbi:cutinase family protein [Cellulomonas sp. JZ18]|uniref:cutinase family protein n=1 Tax=Cellulomonas sp. JZ18 TaxID=2654191 RepID=UPI0018AFDF1E|nr:cutinase family protein [Cellulomonas sp. JZ18]
MHAPRLRRALVAVVALAGALTGGVVVATSATAATGCSDVEVVFARGTGERPGLGIVGAPLVRAVQAELPGRTVSSYAVDYAAAGSQTSAGPGATDMTRHVVARAAACPGTQFVLGGYSQGATVTDIAIGIRTGVTTGEAIPAQLADRVAAVVVYGNPLGLSGRTIAQASPTYGPKAKEFCNSGDPVCQRGGGNFGAHITYATNGTVQEGARFAAGLIAQTPPTPAPTAPVPTPAPTAPGQPATCVTASTREHVEADRAVRLGLRTYARGSRDALGYYSSRTQVSLTQTADGWDRVPTC